MSLDREEFLHFCAIMESLNERQQGYYVRLAQRMAADPEFSARMDREGVIVSALLRSENYRELDRLFRRGLLRLVKSEQGGIQ